MIVEKSKLHTATPEERRRAIDMVANGATLQQAATAVGFTKQAVSLWVKAAEKSLPRSCRPASIAQGQREPVYVNGKRLGRLALWT